MEQFASENLFYRVVFAQNRRSIDIGARKIKFIPVYFCAMYLENIMLPLVPLAVCSPFSCL